MKLIYLSKLHGEQNKMQHTRATAMKFDRQVEVCVN